MINGNPLLGQVLGGLFGQALGRRGMGGRMGGGLGGAALGSVLAGALGRGRARSAGGALGGNRGTLVMLLLPLAMRWVQKQGGIGAVLKRFQQRGYGQQAQSWVATGPNEGVDERAIEEVVGPDELTQLAQRLGVPQQEVAQAFAEIMPEMVNQLTPEGQLPVQADAVLDEGRSELERELAQLEQGEAAVRH